MTGPARPARPARPTGPARPPLARRVLFLLVPYVVFFGLLAGVEGGVRLGLPHLSSLDLFVTAPEQQAQFRDRRLVRIFEGDPLLFWRLLPDLRDVLWESTLVTTNPQGLRYPRPVGPKPAGTVRVVALGDSVTFGFRTPLVFAKRPEERDPARAGYAVLLERWLRAANPGREVEVLPLAVPGYSSHQGLAWLRRDVEWLRPDLVTACFGWNDIGLRAQADADAMPADPASVWARAALARSQALAHAWRALRSRPAAGAPPPGRERVPPGRYVQNLRGIVAAAREHGASVLIIAPVYRDPVSYPDEAARLGRLRAALRDLAARDAVPLLEVAELTEAGHPGNASLFLEHIHPNHRGHRRLAEAVRAAIAAHGLLPGLSVPASGPGDASAAEP